MLLILIEYFVMHLGPFSCVCVAKTRASEHRGTGDLNNSHNCVIEDASAKIS